MKHKSAILGVLVVLIVVGAGFAASPDQPFMESARSDLQKARAELNIAEHNKGGHRSNAIRYVNSAIGEINRGIAFARGHNQAHAGTLDQIFFSATSPDQPHMQSALDRLKDARNNLDRANPDKGGHRAKAIEYVNKAIDEVNLGIAAGR